MGSECIGHLSIVWYTLERCMKVETRLTLGLFALASVAGVGAAPVFAQSDAGGATMSNQRFIDSLDEIELAVPNADAALWTPFAPIQNPPSEAKRVLGKILFWDEQLSSDSTISCGTCHIPSAGGTDPRVGVHPGFDQNYVTADDVIGSPGVLRVDENGAYERADMFGLDTQVTDRVAFSNLMSMFNGSLFWDGRASLNFVDPESGDLLFQSGVAGLEIQSLAPIMNEVEMSHTGRTWGEVRDKLARVRPLAVADSVPADMAGAIEARPTYGELFEDAFGDPEITAVRIAYALATYQRTLVPNETPWDLWNDGQTDAMTAQQITGYTAYQASACTFCHPAPTYANSDFFVDGVRPPFEDRGRQNVTGLNSDRGAFRTPSIRNMGLRDKLMHTGTLSNVDDIMDHYAHRNGRQPFGDNLNGIVAGRVRFSAGVEVAVKDFLVNGLTDPRVANETFPFDRPKLHSERGESNPAVLGSGDVGSGGFVPQMLAVIPPNLGNDDFKIGVDFALGGAEAWVAVSQNPAVDGVLAADQLFGPITLRGMGDGGGYGTLAYPIDNNLALDGQRLYMQWLVNDPAGAGGDGFIRSAVAQIDIFCTESIPCTIACTADFTGDGLSDFFDVSAFLGAFGAQNSAADINGDGSFNFLDVSEFLAAFAVGCP